MNPKLGGTVTAFKKFRQRHLDLVIEQNKRLRDVAMWIYQDRMDIALFNLLCLIKDNSEEIRKGESE